MAGNFPCFGEILKIPSSSAIIQKKVSLSDSFLIYTILVSDLRISKSRKLIEFAGEPSKKPLSWVTEGSDTVYRKKNKTKKWEIITEIRRNKDKKR